LPLSAPYHNDESVSPFPLLATPPPPPSTLFPYTTLFRSDPQPGSGQRSRCGCCSQRQRRGDLRAGEPLSDRSKFWQWRQHSNHRSEEHTSELQSRFDLVCRLLLEKKKI